MKHLIVCREYPPAPYPAGGIGTYVTHIARLLAGAGETVHILAQRWDGAPRKVTELCGGKLIIHRVSLDEPVETGMNGEARLLRGLAESDCPSQAFSWQTARFAERLVQSEGVDLIEAPEWEAPLYYLQVRRAMGLGPERRPPCLIHLHSPAELVVRHNEWDLSFSDLQPLFRLEAYSVKAADALVCPSRYLSLGAEQLFGVSGISRIPYPLGDTLSIERGPAVWARDSVCYVGRLELRKGVVEWVDAAVETARQHPTVDFQFVGSDTSLDGTAGTSVREFLKRRIPRELRGRFRFEPNRSRSELSELLAEMPLAVVPSRWENLPFTCIEAMCTGLPVLVSPNGGMSELVTDGESGWVSPDVTPAGLAATLRRVLATPAGERAAMGRRAEAAVRRICSNEAVLEQHLELRTRLAGRTVVGPRRAGAIEGRQGMGIVVTCLENLELLHDCLAGIANQTQKPEAMVIVVEERFDLKALIGVNLPDLGIVTVQQSSVKSARAAGAEKLSGMAPMLRGVVFVTENVRLEPDYVKVADGVLRDQPGLGAMACMVRRGDSGSDLDAVACPVDIDALPCVAIRGLSGSGGWAAVTYPEVLASIAAGRVGRRRYSAMALAQGSSAKMAVDRFLAATLAEKAGYIGRALREPRRLGQWIFWRLRNAMSGAR